MLILKTFKKYIGKKTRSLGTTGAWGQFRHEGN